MFYNLEVVKVFFEAHFQRNSHRDVAHFLELAHLQLTVVFLSVELRVRCENHRHQRSGLPTKEGIAIPILTLESIRINSEAESPKPTHIQVRYN